MEILVSKLEFSRVLFQKCQEAFNVLLVSLQGQTKRTSGLSMEQQMIFSSLNVSWSFPLWIWV